MTSGAGIGTGSVQIDGRHPVRSILRILRRRPGRLAIAVAAFTAKEIPVWFLPAVTAAVIDIVSKKGDVGDVLLWFVVAALLLLQNYPNTLLYTRNFMTVVRDAGADLRNAFAANLGTTPESAPRSFRTRWSATWRTSRSCFSKRLLRSSLRSLCSSAAESCGELAPPDGGLTYLACLVHAGPRESVYPLSLPARLRCARCSGRHRYCPVH
jgi:hypothetical protein